ncbi:MAG: inorganic phosphate transporter, partial [Mycobacteriales bacterium]
MDLLPVIVIIATALIFDYTNGFHDAANAIATSVSTRAFTPRVALGLAAVANLVGALLGEGVAKTVGSGIIDPPKGSHGLLIVFCGVVGGIVWNLLTWYFGLPSSSSHALIGGLVGSALAASAGIHWGSITGKVIIPMIASPLIGLVLAYLFMLAILWIFRRGTPGRLSRGFRWAQRGSATAMAVGH